VDDPDRRDPPDLDADRDRVGRVAVDVVRRPVQGVHDPADARAPRSARALLAEDRVVGSTRDDALDDQALGLAIDLGHEVVRGPLLVDVEQPSTSGGVELGGARRELDREVQELVEVRRARPVVRRRHRTESRSAPVRRSRPERHRPASVHALAGRWIRAPPRRGWSVGSG
jgi:hypothetical protein